jgi:ketosteroid isomerase-like protein
MDDFLKQRLNSLYAAFKFEKIDFLLNSIDEDIEFISYSPLEALPFLGHHRGKAAMAEVLKAGYAEFEFLAYEPVFMVCEAENAAVIIFARVIHRRTRRSVQTIIAHFLRFREGRIIEVREFMDSFAAVEQLLGHKINLD